MNETKQRQHLKRRFGNVSKHKMIQNTTEVQASLPLCKRTDQNEGQSNEVGQNVCTQWLVIFPITLCKDAYIWVYVVPAETLIIKVMSMYDHFYSDLLFRFGIASYLEDFRSRDQECKS